MALPQYLSVYTVAERLQCSYDAALRIMRACGATKIGGIVRVEEDRLVSYLETWREKGKDRTSTSGRAAPVGTATSTEKIKTSALKPTTKQKPYLNSQSCRNSKDFERLRKAIGR